MEELTLPPSVSNKARGKGVVVENFGYFVGIILGIAVVVNVVAGILSLAATYGLTVLLVHRGYAAPSEHGESPMQRARGRAWRILRVQLGSSIIAFVAGAVLFVLTVRYTFVMVVDGLAYLIGLEPGVAQSPASAVLLYVTSGVICALLTHLPTQFTAYWFAFRRTAWLR